MGLRYSGENLYDPLMRLTVPAKIVRSVSLTPELTALIDAKLASGHYGNASEVVRAALRLMAEQDERTQLKFSVQDERRDPR